MKLQRQLKYLFSIIVAISFSASLNAQVTIGSDKAPSSGALLDLKTETNGTAKKGLGLPRVTLTSLTRLKMGTAAEITNATQKENHAGLMVYVTTKFGYNNCPGIYVWTGQEWDYLNQPSKPDITMTDDDGNVYKAKWFSADPCDPDAEGNYWITSNLYTTQKKGGGEFPANTVITLDQKRPRINPAIQQTSGALTLNIGVNTWPSTTISFGESTSSSIAANNRTLTAKEFAKEFGLLYTYAQAQVACPDGWRLPKKADWDNMIAGVQYVRYLRKHQYYYRSADATPLVRQWGEIDSDRTITTFSGFDAVPSGGVTPNTTTKIASPYNWGHYAFWWGFTLNDTRFIYHDTQSFNTGQAMSSSVNSYLSVRCVQDN